MNIRSTIPLIFVTLLFFVPAAYSKSDFETFITSNPLPVESDITQNKKVAKLLYGTWVLKSDVEGETKASLKPGFIHFSTSGDLFTSESYFRDGGWFNTTSKHHVVGGWEFNAEKSLPISQAVISEVISYIEQTQKKVDEQDLLVMQRFPEANNLRVDQRGDFLRKHREELKDIFSDKSVDRRGLKKAKEILPMLRQGLADEQDTLYFGGLKTNMSPEFDPVARYKDKRDFERFHIKTSTTTYLSGKTLYLKDLRRKGMRRIIFEKTPIAPNDYPENIANFYQNKLQDAVKTRANDIYDDLNQVCAHWRKIQDQIPDGALESCHKQRDSLLSLGVNKKGEYKFIDESSVKIPSGLEKLLKFTAEPINPSIKASELPSLDYCISHEYSERDNETMARIAKQNFTNTAFSVYIEPTIDVKPNNWGQASFEQYRAMRFNTRMLYLREDGVIGFSQEKFEGPSHAPKRKTYMYYDPTNTWDYTNNKINLEFHDGSVTLTLYVGSKLHMSPSVQNTSGMDFYDEESKLHLIRWNVNFLRNADNGCANFTSKKESTAFSNTDHRNNPSPTTRSQEAKLNKPFVLSDYAHFNVVPVDPNAAIAPEIKTMWAKGFYIHLKPDGNFGFNTDNPGPYIYLPVNRWENNNGVLTLTLDKVVYSLTLPSQSSPEETTLTTIDSTWQAFKMTYVTKQKNAR